MTIQELIKKNNIVETHLREELAVILPLVSGEHYTYDDSKVAVRRIEQGKIGSTLRSISYLDSKFKKALGTAINNAITGLTSLKRQMV